jgi:tRNA threonylcarbamoyl adenosine modification protein YeaZ
MRRLVIETSGADCSIALLDGQDIIAERHERVGRGHAERLIPWIAALPAGGRADEILVGCGPGSFTGVRIAIAAARGLAIGWGVPVHGVSSLALVAVGQSEPALTVAVEGGHGEIFVQDFMLAPFYQAGPMRSLTPEAAAQISTNACVAGSGAERLVAARGYGTAVNGEARASQARLLPEAFTTLPARPVYGRGADAKAMA